MTLNFVLHQYKTFYGGIDFLSFLLLVQVLQASQELFRVDHEFDKEQPILNSTDDLSEISQYQEKSTE